MINFLHKLIALFCCIVVQLCPDLAMEYCYSETFEPRCATNEVIVMERAMFGRMSDQGRCLQPDSLMDALKHDPRYLGCSHDVLPVTDRRCSGRTECSIRIVDPELQQNSPCYREMEKYMDASYTCVNVVQPDRTCEVAVNAEGMFLSSLTESSSENIACGSRDRPWLLEAPSGQRINISLLDFSGSLSPTSNVHRSRTVETGSSSGCVRQFGFIEDKSANRNINICGSDTAHRQQTLYVSQTNEVAIVLHTAQRTTGNFLIAVKAVGCSDLVPPSDAWLKRSDNVATVGCYMTRQTWILSCDQTGRWTGTFGNCTQQLLAIRDSSDVIIRPAESKQHISEDIRVIILVAIIGVSSLVCVTIICVGVTWLCRLRSRKSRIPQYRCDNILTSLDVKSTAPHSVVYE